MRSLNTPICIHFGFFFSPQSSRAGKISVINLDFQRSEKYLELFH